MNNRPSDTPLDQGRPAPATQGACVELRRHAGDVEVRDSKDPHGPALRFTPSEFAAWLDGAKKAEFDHLAQP